MDMRQLNIRVNPELFNKVTRKAIEFNISRNELMTKILERFFKAVE